MAANTTPVLTDSLLPCPFCGGAVEIEEAYPTRDSFYGERRWWGVVCRNTMNRGGSCAIQQRPSASQEAAIERWNRRAQPAPAASPAPLTDEQIAALHESLLRSPEYTHDRGRWFVATVRHIEAAHGIKEQ